MDLCTSSIMPFEVPVISMRRNDFSRWGWASLVYMTMTILIRPLNSTAPSALKISVPLKALGNQATTAGKIKCTCCEWFPVGSLIYVVQPQGSHPASLPCNTASCLVSFRLHKIPQCAFCSHHKHNSVCNLKKNNNFFFFCLLVHQYPYPRNTLLLHDMKHEL